MDAEGGAGCAAALLAAIAAFAGGVAVGSRDARSDAARAVAARLGPMAGFELREVEPGRLWSASKDGRLGAGPTPWEAVEDWAEGESDDASGEGVAP